MCLYTAHRAVDQRKAPKQIIVLSSLTRVAAAESACLCCLGQGKCPAKCECLICKIEMETRRSAADKPLESQQTDSV